VLCTLSGHPELVAELIASRKTVCAVSGPPEKPYAVAVITVLTLEMALGSFSHLIRVAQEEHLTSVRAAAA
jgi:hypothetical protein